MSVRVTSIVSPYASLFAGYSRGPFATGAGDLETGEAPGQADSMISQLDCRHSMEHY